MISAARSEHRRLLRIVVRVQRRARRAMAGETGVPLEMLDELIEDLKRHFATEEAPGGIYEALEAQPDIAPDVARLRSDHQSLQTWAGLVRTRVAVPDAPNEAAEHVEAFLRALADHESKEEQLMQRLRSTPDGSEA